MDIQWTFTHQLPATNQAFAKGEASHQALLAGSPLELQEPAVESGLGPDI